MSLVCLFVCLSVCNVDVDVIVGMPRSLTGGDGDITRQVPYLTDVMWGMGELHIETTRGTGRWIMICFAKLFSLCSNMI